MIARNKLPMRCAVELADITLQHIQDGVRPCWREWLYGSPVAPTRRCAAITLLTGRIVTYDGQAVNGAVA